MRALGFEVKKEELKKIAESYQPGGPPPPGDAEDDDEDVPDLVDNFESSAD